jgi:hypothetical protein
LAEPLWICRDPGGVERWIGNAGTNQPEGQCTPQSSSRSLVLTSTRATPGVTPAARPQARRVSADSALTPRGSEWTVSIHTQQARDSDSRTILEDELARETARLARLREEKQPTPQFLRAIKRSEQDVAALQREIARLR